MTDTNSQCTVKGGGNCGIVNRVGDVTDITCIRGEMTAQVYNANLMGLLSEAGMRPYVIAAMIILAKSEDPKAAFKTIAERATRRYF